MLPDGTGIKQNKICFLLVLGKAEAHLLKHSLDFLSVGNILLTAVGSDHRQRRFLLRPDGHDFRRELCIFLRLNCQKTHLTDLTYFILVYHNAPYFSTETNVKTAILQ